MKPREKFVGLLKEEGITCDELHMKGYIGTILKINKKICYVPQDKSGPWYQVKPIVLDDAVVLIFLAELGAQRGLPKAFLVSSEDFHLTANALGESPIDGDYNVNISGSEWKHIELKISLGDHSPSVIVDPDHVFPTFELLECDDDEVEITKAFRRVEQKLNQ